MRLQLWTVENVSCSLEVWDLFSNKYDITKHEQYKYLSDYDEKNTFDVEKYMKNLHRAKVKESDVLEDVFESKEIIE